jgi:RNA polymerase sigma-70 factor (ECF subfamily)
MRRTKIVYDDFALAKPSIGHRIMERLSQTLPLPSGLPPRDDIREQQLLARVITQDRQAFEELYLSYHRRLTRFVMRLAPRYDIAEEVINDTFWIVWKKAAEFRGGSQVSTWIMGIAYRRALKALHAYKSQHRWQDTTMHASDNEDSSQTHDPIETDATRSWVMQGLAQLPLDQRMVIELAYYLGHSCEEIASITQCPVGTVKARMFHARKKLKLLLPQLAGEMDL